MAQAAAAFDSFAFAVPTLVLPEVTARLPESTSYRKIPT